MVISGIVRVYVYCATYEWIPWRQWYRDTVVVYFLLNKLRSCYHVRIYKSGTIFLEVLRVLL